MLLLVDWQLHLVHQWISQHIDQMQTISPGEYLMIILSKKHLRLTWGKKKYGFCRSRSRRFSLFCLQLWNHGSTIFSSIQKPSVFTGVRNLSASSSLDLWSISGNLCNRSGLWLSVIHVDRTTVGSLQQSVFGPVLSLWGWSWCHVFNYPTDAEAAAGEVLLGLKSRNQLTEHISGCSPERGVDFPRQSFSCDVFHVSAVQFHADVGDMSVFRLRFVCWVFRARILLWIRLSLQAVASGASFTSFLLFISPFPCFLLCPSKSCMRSYFPSKSTSQFPPCSPPDYRSRFMVPPVPVSPGTWPLFISWTRLWKYLTGERIRETWLHP